MYVWWKRTLALQNWWTKLSPLLLYWFKKPSPSFTVPFCSQQDVYKNLITFVPYFWNPTTEITIKLVLSTTYIYFAVSVISFSSSFCNSFSWISCMKLKICSHTMTIIFAKAKKIYIYCIVHSPMTLFE